MYFYDLMKLTKEERHKIASKIREKEAAKFSKEIDESLEKTMNEFLKGEDN